MHLWSDLVFMIVAVKQEYISWGLLKLLWVLGFEFDCQSHFFLPSYFYLRTSKEPPWMHKEWNFTGMLQKLASTRLQLRNKEMGLEWQLECVLLIFKLNFSLETCLDWLSFKEQTTTNLTSLLSISSANIYFSFFIFYHFLFIFHSSKVNSSLLYKTEAKLFIITFWVIYHLSPNHFPPYYPLNNSNGKNNNSSSFCWYLFTIRYKFI